MATRPFIDIPYSILRPDRAKRVAMFERRSELEKLVAVAEAGKIVAAADRLALTQPALTRAIARLESRFEANMIVCVESYVGAPGGPEGVKLEQPVPIAEHGPQVLSALPLDAAGF